jgi:hypothetical protein
MDRLVGRARAIRPPFFSYHNIAKYTHKIRHIICSPAFVSLAVVVMVGPVSGDTC